MKFTGKIKIHIYVNSGSVKVSGKLPTYPSPNPTLILTSHFGQNVGLGEGLVGSFPETLTPEMEYEIRRVFSPVVLVFETLEPLLK